MQSSERESRSCSISVNVQDDSFDVFILTCRKLPDKSARGDIDAFQREIRFASLADRAAWKCIIYHRVLRNAAVTTHYDKILIAVLIADNDVGFPIGRRSALNRSL